MYPGTKARLRSPALIINSRFMDALPAKRLQKVTGSPCEVDKRPLSAGDIGAPTAEMGDFTCIGNGMRFAQKTADRDTVGKAYFADPERRGNGGDEARKSGRRQRPNFTRNSRTARVWRANEAR